MTRPVEKSDARRLIEATAWRTRLTELELESTPAFEAWLADDPRNADAWSRVQVPWDFFGEHATAPELLELRRQALGEARDAGRERWRNRRVRPWGAGIAAAIVLFSIAALLTWNFLRPDVYRTSAGERRAVTLADGSQVQLDALSELRVSYSLRARDLKLVRGQARFDVVHDVERPFAVFAAGQKVIATGTAFNMEMLDSDLLVTLIEGRVVILPDSAAKVTRSAADQGNSHTAAGDHSLAAGTQDGPRERREIILTAGQQYRISTRGVAYIEPANLQRTSAWQTGQLIFEDEPLSAVVVRLNRYAARPLRVVDDEAAALRISGVFNAADTDGFVATITHYLPVAADYSQADVVELRTR